MLTAINEAISYDPNTGAFEWRVRSRNRRKAPLNSRHSEGYLEGNIGGKHYFAHRVAWAITYGDWPDHIDHINGDKTDNRIENLRNVSKAINGRNAKRSKRNSSGVTGVYFNSAAKKWAAQIRVDRKQIFLGFHPTVELAAGARRAAEQRYGFHQNHGRAA